MPNYTACHPVQDVAPRELLHAAAECGRKKLGLCLHLFSRCRPNPHASYIPVRNARPMTTRVVTFQSPLKGYWPIAGRTCQAIGPSLINTLRAYKSADRAKTQRRMANCRISRLLLRGQDGTPADDRNVQAAVMMGLPVAQTSGFHLNSFNRAANGIDAMAR